MQGASVKQTRSVCSERARAPAGGRSRCGFAKQIRGFSAQCPSPKQMRCRLSFSCPPPAPTEAPNRGESNSVQGASVRKTSRQRRVGRAFLTVAQRKLHPRISAQNGMHFPDGLLAESSPRNPRSERDALSQRRSKRKAHPGMEIQTGMRFPLLKLWGRGATARPMPMPAARCRRAPWPRRRGHRRCRRHSPQRSRRRRWP